MTASGTTKENKWEHLKQSDFKFQNGQYGFWVIQIFIYLYIYIVIYSIVIYSAV